MTAPMIELERLCAAHIEQLGCEGCDIYDTAYPTIYRLLIDGAEWWTDRFWMLPSSMLTTDVNSNWKIVDLPESSAAKPVEWIRKLGAGLEDGCSAKFAPTFAGVLTEAGLTARGITGEQHMCTLIDSDAKPVGLIMPVRLADDRGEFVTTIPAPDSVMKQHAHLASLQLIHEPDLVWSLAVALAQTTPVTS